ncbi:hypothetical protein Smp_161880 [Schistosoma mansoni]|uniref:Uncharacterized protein n=1 Tax=Schistosoma mansoni TaxID=6183 RepID=G4VSV4_SCHMA|nr:hypothetical protein Smp_161880 [Schistosoma mansoni]|eukprot:XP_018655534.1 hypothetical protein Smp_161880 [Schistosoma mansoni]
MRLSTARIRICVASKISKGDVDEAMFYEVYRSSIITSSYEDASRSGRKEKKFQEDF